MAQDKENPLSRWSRLKREAEAPKPARKAAPGPAPRAPETPMPELPPLDQLTPDSDFSAFMDPRVDERLRRLALKRLFSDPRLNVVDGLDDFAEDYTLLEDLPQELVAKLEHARSTLRRPDPEAEKEQDKETQPEQDLAQAAATEPEAKAEDNEDEGDDPQDVPRRQDT
jgi:hypothetical protein